MNSNRSIQERALSEVCKALTSLQEKTVFVGGAVVSLYADDSATEDVRATKDVDIVVEAASRPGLEELRKELGTRGFRQFMNEETMCRFRLGEILVDVMVPQDVGGWAPGNRWFASGFKSAGYHKLASGQKIRLLPVEYFLAAKFEAYHDRADDPRWSQDLEDILYIVNNRERIVGEIGAALPNVREFLVEESRVLLSKPDIDEILITATTDQARVGLVKQKIQQIAEKSDR